jgi:hypothetical protein
MNILLLFPPSWTLVSGTPHLALPLLAAYLRQNGLEVDARDLNWECASSIVDGISEKEARFSCKIPTLESLNDPYFRCEDVLMARAATFDGTWNAQCGFEYDEFSHSSSRDALHAASLESPFTHFFESGIIPSIQVKKPNIIGFCIAAAQQLIPTLQLCFLLRRAGYDGFIVLGGNTVSRLLNEMQLQGLFDLVDGLVTFQGELPLLRLCEAIRDGKSLERVPQLIWRDLDRIRHNNQSVVLDVNSVPAPDFSGLPVGRYWGANYLSMVGARGCYYGKCSFCAIPFGWGNNGYSGARDVSKVYEDMLFLIHRHGIRRFKFVDEALPIRMMSILSDMILADGVDIEWEGYTRLERAWLDQSFVDKVARAGFRKGYFGLEVIPSTGRSALNKRDSCNPLSLLQSCARAGVKVHFFCMFGFPGTDSQDAHATHEFLLDHSDLIDTADIFPWGYTKHTSVPQVEPILDPALDWALEFPHRAKDPGTMSSAEIVALASVYEEMLWDEVPRFLHPTYRLVSPWSSEVRPAFDASVKHLNYKETVLS